MIKKFLVWLTTALSVIITASIGSPSAQANTYLPEYASLAEHNQWGIREMAVDKVAELGLTGTGVKVAVLDSGISLSTPGINNKVIAYKDFLPSQQQLPDHGTQSAGIIFSDFDASTGLRGVAPNASLIVGRVCQMRSCDSIAIRKGLAWAVEQGAQVISMSFAGGGDPYMNAAITAAVTQGVVVVAAAGNNGCQTIAPWGVNRFCRQGVISEQYSASFTIPGLISAGAIDQTRARASFSSWGPNLDLMAPGVNSVTYDPVGPTNGFGGTSASTPYIAGVAALVLSINPKLSPAQVQAILQSTTKPALATKPKVWDSCSKNESTNTWSCDNQVDNDFPQEYFTGAGVVNALAAVRLTQQLSSSQLLTKPVAIATGNKIKITWPGGPAALYSNNKLVAPNAASGFTITGGDSQSYSFHIKRAGLLSEPELLVLQKEIKPSAPIVINASARSDEILLNVEDLVAEIGQLASVFGEVAGIFEFENGKQIACVGYSPAPSDAESRPYFFSCPANNLEAKVIGSFRLVSKFSQVGPSTPVEITNVGPAFNYLEVKTKYSSSDSILFDWEDVPGALSYYYRYLPNGEYSCTTESQFSLTGKSSQPSVFAVEANDGKDCDGMKLAQSDYHGYVLLSPKPEKPTGITVVANEYMYVEFNIPNAIATDQWRIYRSDGLVIRISAGQKIAVGMQPNENVNGKTFSYRIMQVVTDTWGEVWSEPSDPITVAIRELASPTNVNCYQVAVRNSTICELDPNREVESTLLEYVDFDGVVISSTRVFNNSQQAEHIQPEISSAAFVRVSALTGRENEWMRRGKPTTVRIQSRTAIGLAYTAH
jgi:subtilisin family serine protease